MAILTSIKKAAWLCLFSLVAARSSAAQNSEEIAQEIAKAKQAIVQYEARNGVKEEELLFLTFWNFDNTILNGDTTEGSSDLYGKVIFKGLAQLAIESGYSKKYSSFKTFWSDYQAMERENEPKAWAYVAQILAGAQRSAVLKLATNYFQTTLKPHLFQASMDLIARLQKENISVQVITASPQIFVQGAAPLLGIKLEDVYGMETLVKEGVLTSELVYPLTTREGKVQKIQEIVKKKLGEYKNVYVLAGFGNYNLNDIYFIKWTAAQSFKAGKPLGVIDYHLPPSTEKNIRQLPLLEEIGNGSKR